MDQDQGAANALIAEANQALADGWIDRAIAAYRAAIDRFPPYGSYHLVIGDVLAADGRLIEAVDAYRATVEAVPEHDQAWESLAESLHRVGRHEEGGAAEQRARELRAQLRPDDGSDAIARLRRAPDINARAEIIGELLHTADDQVSELLHRFLGEVAHDQRTGRHGTGNTFWSAVASILVRFGMAEHLDWYSDGPAPSQVWLMEDVDRYLRGNRHPPPLDEQQPIRHYPSG